MIEAMKNAIILHGRPSKKEYYDPTAPSMSNAHWLPWLQGQLLKRNVSTATPEVPLSFKPQWRLWCKEVERFEINPGTIIVGHSCGGGFWARWLSEHKDVSVGKVVLVAPWIDPDNILKGIFFDFKIDPNLADRTKGITIFSSDNDHPKILESVKILRDQIKGIKYKEFNSYGHFCYEDMKTAEFPELLAEVLG